jgi:hypothetical protein
MLLLIKHGISVLYKYLIDRLFYIPVAVRTIFMVNWRHNVSQLIKSDVI